ncbi:pilus assembly protein CblD [Scandinavium goeteborgense]|uniref:CfaE/CblD family pilus tip adhesin n=1 Tax=Scandinavium goeteborgense TaxID=1851514 RepID=UPI0021655A4D|nr:CfaE/CblD family pilus tip adhesin [Scandinavium goeteborgense]MCS2154524.1 pilus assembly protein CblD [Scandinavium goeteborgense]
MQNFYRTFFIFLAMSLLLLLACPKAKAEVVPPTNQETAISLEYVKGSAASNLYVWNEQQGGYDTSNTSRWGLNYWVCTSDVSTEYGKCSTVSESYSTYEPIALEFTEKRSGIKAVITFKGIRSANWIPGSGCGSEGDPKRMNIEAQNNCSGQMTSGTLLKLYAEASELNKIPVGGVWTATLKIIESNGNETERYNWTANITLDVTDFGNQQIYLPEFGSAAPHVDLNLRPLPGTKGNHTVLSGTASLDMCLYDGYNANSSTFTLNAHDQTSFADGRESSMFSVYNQGQGDEGHRIDYHLEILDPTTNAYSTMANMQDYVIRNIQQVPLRSVYLPGIPQPVVCVPSRLRFTTPEFAIASKQAGTYTGVLKLFLTTQM